MSNMSINNKHKSCAIVKQIEQLQETDIKK